MNDKDFIKIVKEAHGMFHASKLVGMSYGIFKRKAIKLNCWSPNQGGKGVKDGPSSRRIPTQEILEGKHPQYQTYKLKIRLIDEGFIKDECMKCKWGEKPEGVKYTPCELEHNNGIPTDHRWENLSLLCPNCHSLTKTYRFRRGKTNGK